MKERIFLFVLIFWAFNFACRKINRTPLPVSPQKKKIEVDNRKEKEESPPLPTSPDTPVFDKPPVDNGGEKPKKSRDNPSSLPTEDPKEWLPLKVAYKCPKIDFMPTRLVRYPARDVVTGICIEDLIEVTAKNNKAVVVCIDLSSVMPQYRIEKRNNKEYLVRNGSVNPPDRIVVINIKICTPVDKHVIETIPAYVEMTLMPFTKVAFADEFDGDKLKTEYWNNGYLGEYKTLWNEFTLRNAARDLLEVKGGSLWLRSDYDGVNANPRCAAVTSQNKVSLQYGELSIRARVRKAGNGAWPALWLDPQNTVYSGWPDCGEIDMFEHIDVQDKAYFIVKQKDNTGGFRNNVETRSFSLYDWHIYTLYKMKEHIEIYFDGHKVLSHKKADLLNNSSKKWPFETDFYLILNQSSGPIAEKRTSEWWTQPLNIHQMPFEFEIDWVRIYTRPNDNCALTRLK